jgi:trehalose 6-phosphate synthase
MGSIDWHGIARTPHLAVVCDLDGTLIPFANTLDDAMLDDDVASLLSGLSATAGTTVAVISGRPRASIATMLDRAPGVRWFAEHGAWRLDGGTWHAALDGDAPFDGLLDRLERLVAVTPGARIERKTWSVCVHWRGIAEPARTDLIEAATLAMDEWLEERPQFERLPSAEAAEVRHRAVHKGAALSYLRRQLPSDTRFVAIGDDRTDEDMFQALGTGDASVVVTPGGRATLADAVVDGIDGARSFLIWLATRRMRRDAHARAATQPPTHDPERRADDASLSDLVVVSNRLPNPPSPAPDDRNREAGGLVSALEPALVEHRAIWLGWSGHEREPGLDVTIERDRDDVPVRASFHFPPGWRERFYDGFCNQALWPLLHCFQARVRYQDDDWACYEQANRAYAAAVARLTHPDGTIWLHDYHLFLVARELRARGHRGPIGLFLHVPFPPLDLFETLPWARDVIGALLELDVLGFHTKRWADNFILCARSLDGRNADKPRVAVIPIGIDPAAFAGDVHATPSPTIEPLRASLDGRKLILGVDRLDYSKGIPERLYAFRRLLELFPEWRRKVELIQVSVPSRADVPEYAELRRVVENLVGRINGELGEADWVPVRYLYRSYDPASLAQLYRVADIGLVTPLRDGMNLVAKEFVASQDPDDPGVLLLSRFAGAAEGMPDALLTNPFHADGIARDLDRALRMPLEERRRRWRGCQDEVERHTSEAWARRFLGLLAEARDASKVA